ncbi:MAG: hypothetical protein KDC38_20785 [Planctomycetes bacterium]|nr:hypothetical protein [Planctomycetota bacterium]
MAGDTGGVPCYGCGAVLPASDGPTHRYIGASPGCWALYGELLVRAHSEPRWPTEHRLIVDIYAAQHPGTESLQAIRSVAGHSIVLCLVLEQDLPLSRIAEVLRRTVKNPRLHWLTPPQSLGEITVVDLYRERDPDRYGALCLAWARCVWAAWSEHHETIRGWASGLR